MIHSQEAEMDVGVQLTVSFLIQSGAPNLGMVSVIVEPVDGNGLG